MIFKTINFKMESLGSNNFISCPEKYEELCTVNTTNVIENLDRNKFNTSCPEKYEELCMVTVNTTNVQNIQPSIENPVERFRLFDNSNKCMIFDSLYMTMNVNYGKDCIYTPTSFVFMDDEFKNYIPYMIISIPPFSSMIYSRSFKGSNESSKRFHLISTNSKLNGINSKYANLNGMDGQNMDFRTLFFSTLQRMSAYARSIVKYEEEDFFTHYINNMVNSEENFTDVWFFSSGSSNEQPYSRHEPFDLLIYAYSIKSRSENAEIYVNNIYRSFCQRFYDYNQRKMHSDEPANELVLLKKPEDGPFVQNIRPVKVGNKKFFDIKNALGNDPCHMNRILQLMKFYYSSEVFISDFYKKSVGIEFVREELMSKEIAMDYLKLLNEYTPTTFAYIMLFFNRLIDHLISLQYNKNPMLNDYQSELKRTFLHPFGCVKLHEHVFSAIPKESNKFVNVINNQITRHNIMVFILSSPLTSFQLWNWLIGERTTKLEKTNFAKKIHYTGTSVTSDFSKGCYNFHYNNLCLFPLVNLIVFDQLYPRTESPILSTFEKFFFKTESLPKDYVYDDHLYPELPTCNGTNECWDIQKEEIPKEKELIFEDESTD